VTSGRCNVARILGAARGNATLTAGAPATHDRPVLPGPYERWFTEIAGRPAAVESRATCDRCAMLPGAPELPPEGPFHPETRCCTYHPELAPHFVGGILAAGTDEGRARVKRRIADRTGVTPLGLAPGPERAAARPGAFGRDPALRCPFFDAGDAGRCTIWEHRGAGCAAYHCKFDRGVLGQGLWHLTFVAFNVVERALARWLLGRHGLEVAACDALLHAPRDADLDARAWKSWRGREEEYFLDAHRSIAPLAWAEVVALGGRELAELGAALRGAVERFDALRPPQRVRRGDDVLHHIGRPGRVRLQHPTIPDDLLEVPADLAARLAGLDDTPLAALGVDDDLAKRLLDWRILRSSYP